MVDFHTHILPKMDDGSRSSEESVAMLRMLAEQGIKRVVLTPHYYPEAESPEDCLRRRESVNSRCLPSTSVRRSGIMTGSATPPRLPG